MTKQPDAIEYLTELRRLDPADLAAAARQHPDRWNALCRNVDGIVAEFAELHRLVRESIEVVEKAHRLLIQGQQTTH